MFKRRGDPRDDQENDGAWFVPIRKRLFFPISALGENFILEISTNVCGKFFARLDLDHYTSFLDEHLAKVDLRLIRLIQYVILANN